MRLAKAARTQPARARGRRSSRRCRRTTCVAKTEIAGPGLHQLLHDARRLAGGDEPRARARATRYGRGERRRRQASRSSSSSRRIPTGPLHVGHGRHAAFGATVANLLEADGWRVHREYYVNDAGRQMDILAASVWLRYLELCGETLPFPGERLPRRLRAPGGARACARRTATRCAVRAAEVLAGLPPDEPQGGDKDQYIDAVIARAQEAARRRRVPHRVRRGPRPTCSRTSATTSPSSASRFDRWYSEQDLGDGRDGGPIDRALAAPARERPRVRAGRRDLVPRDASSATRRTASWCAPTAQKTYFASDIAYHLDKRERGFDLLVTILGADHHGYVARVRAGLAAMGEPPESPRGADGPVRHAVRRAARRSRWASARRSS